MPTTFQAIAVRPVGDTFVLSLKRPQAANALNTAMAKEIAQGFSELPPTARAVILTGEGKHFCAGADLKERKGMSDTQWQEQHQAFEAALHALLACPVPVIAAVNGGAFGGGMELALACDFIYAADTARFGLTETTLGIMPGMGGTQMLPRVVGMARAKELIFTGRAFTATQAQGWGMVNKISDVDKLMDDALVCAKVISANGPLAVRAAKKSINQGFGLTLEQRLQCELEHYNTLLNTHDRNEGINAFNENRKANFTGA